MVKSTKLSGAGWRKRHTVQVNKSVALFAIALTALGLLSPTLLTERSFKIYDYLNRSLIKQDVIILVDASLRLVLMNILRSLPLYLGVFFVMEAVRVKPESLSFSVLTYILSILSLLGMYHLIWIFYKVRYTVELPVVLVMLIIRLLSVLPAKLPGKIVLILLFFMSVQCLDITPNWTQYGFGRGEISLDIKSAATVLDGEGVLAAISLVMFVFFAVCSGLTSYLMFEQHQFMKVVKANQQMQRSLFRSREEAITARNDREMQSLVHDLKAPLMTISGLASLSILQEGSKYKEYQQRICDSADVMNSMISQMLYPDYRSSISIRELEETVLSHFSPNENVEKLRVVNRCPDAVVDVNLIRLTRAIINLLENASHAIDPNTGDIVLEFDYDDGVFCILVSDNGYGISSEALETIWEPGYSQDRSTGLGLSFVRQVAMEHGGGVYITSNKGTKTQVTLTLSGGRNER